MSDPESAVEHYLPKLSEPGKRWARFLGVLLALALLVWLVLELRGVLTPIAVSLAIAYILNPIVTWFEKHNVRRVTSITALYIVGFVVVSTVTILLGAKAIQQLLELSRNVPGYIETIRAWLDEVYPAALTRFGVATQTAATSGPATSGPGIGAPLAAFVQEHGVSAAQTLISQIVTYATSFFGNATYLLTITVLVPMYTFFFLWKFDPLIRAVNDHLPARYRALIVGVVTTIDRATADFFRGRLIICAVVGVLTAVGWMFVPNLRYAVPLGILVGVLNLVPLLPLVVLPPALLFCYLGSAEAGASWFWPAMVTIGVFMLVQGLENFVLSPWISGKSLGLHPITTVVALLIGAQFAGLLGMLLSIPLASTLKSLGSEFLMPEIKRLAGEREKPPQASPGEEKD